MGPYLLRRALRAGVRPHRARALPVPAADLHALRHVLPPRHAPACVSRRRRRCARGRLCAVRRVAAARDRKRPAVPHLRATRASRPFLRGVPAPALHTEASAVSPLCNRGGGAGRSPALPYVPGLRECFQLNRPRSRLALVD